MYKTKIECYEKGAFRDHKNFNITTTCTIITVVLVIGCCVINYPKT